MSHRSHLTGSKKIVYDSCVDLHNAVLKWRTLTANSHSTIKKIWTVKQVEMNENVAILSSNFSEETYTEIEKLSSELMSKMEDMELVVKKLQGIASKMKSLLELSDFSQTSSMDYSTVTDSIPFKTWSLSKFGTVAKEIAVMFQEEFNVKSSISKEVCLVDKKSKFLFFEACWKFEPNIDEHRLNMLLNGIICELDLFSEIN